MTFQVLKFYSNKIFCTTENDEFTASISLFRLGIISLQTKLRVQLSKLLFL